VPDDPDALAVLIHEYWHYLQNLTTVAGFISFVLEQDFVSTFSATASPSGDGTSLGTDAIGGDIRARSMELYSIRNAREGELDVDGIDGSKVQSFRITGVQEDDYSLTLAGQDVPLRKIVLKIEATMDDGSTACGELLFGQACVEEGIAYLVDRMVAANGSGANAPDDAPPFPYWVLRELALTGSPMDLMAIEIASIGTLSLLTPDPAGIFLELRDAYVDARSGGASAADALDQVWQSMLPNVRSFTDTIINHELPGLLQMHRGRGLMQHAVEWVALQYSAAFARRVQNPIYDLEPFSHNRIDRRALGVLLRTVLPCDVIVEGVGDLHKVERDTLVSFGMPGLSANGHSLSDILRTLEAQNHFVMQHLVSDGFESTDELEAYRETLDDDKMTPCPFYTSCGLQLRKDQPEICFRIPWRIFDPNRRNCWYGTAVASTIGLVIVTGSVRDPREIEQERERLSRLVQRRAYEIWEERHHQPDNDWEHWFQARRELGIADDYFV